MIIRYHIKIYWMQSITQLSLWNQYENHCYRNVEMQEKLQSHKLKIMKEPMCWLPIVHDLAIESYVPFQTSSSTIKTLCFLHLFKALHP